ncbi:MAG: gliding motility-associated C-terminal domain-containing protein [Saprospiraceae bacterium]
MNTFQKLLFFSLLLCTNLVFGQADVSVRVEVENPTPAANELVYATIFVINEGDAYRNDLQVSLRLSRSLFFVDAVTPNSTFDDTALIWDVDQLKTGETDSLRVAVQPNFGGVHTLTAELTSADKVDWDSYPGNDRAQEDDQDQACISVPIAVECGQSLTLTAPRDQTSYSWYRNDELLAYAVHDTLHPTHSGEYRYEVGGNSCASGNCCPVIVDRSMCPHDMALVATATEVTQSSAYQTISLTLFNQGGGAVSKVSLYVTTSRFMRLKPGTTGWQLSGSRMTRDWTGLLQPGDSTQVKFEIQAISGGEADDYQMFSEISAFYAGTTLLEDIDSSPDLDPENDKMINDAYLLSSTEDEDDSDVVSLTDCPVTSVSGNREVCIGESLVLTANANEPSATYNWSGSDQLSCTSCASPTIIVSEDVDLTLTTTTPEGCLQTQVVEVRSKSCVNDILLIAGLNDPDKECFTIAQGAELQFCSDNQVPSAMALIQNSQGTEGCVTARTTGTWGGGFEACLEVCENGDCKPVTLKVIGKPKFDELTATIGEPVCITDLLQMDQSPMGVEVLGGTNDLTLEPSGNDCFEVVTPATSYQTTTFQIIHTYLIFGQTIYDTTSVIVPGQTVCDFEIFAEDVFSIEADPVTQEIGAGELLCLDGALGELLGATYTIDGQSVPAPSTGCEAFQIAKYSLRGLPRRWSDNGWQIISYKKGSRPAFTNFYGATMNDVVAKLKSVDPASTVTFTPDQLLLEIKGYYENPGALVLVHLESNVRLTMQPLIVTGYESWALQIPEGLAIGEYEIAATNAEGCIDVATLNVIEGFEKTVVRDTVYASIELNEPYTVCNLDGFASTSTEWVSLTSDCYVFTPTAIGFVGYQAFTKTENQITTEMVCAITVVDRACAPMMASDEIEVTSSKCRSEYLDLGLTRPDLMVSSSSGRVLSSSQVTGSRDGSRYDISVLPLQGLTTNYTIESWDGVRGAVGTTGNLQEIFQQLRETGFDVDIYWDSNEMTAGALGLGVGDLVLLETTSGQQVKLSPTATSLDTYGRFYGRTGNNSVTVSLATCSEKMVAAVKCQVIVWGGGSIFLNGESGSGTIMGLASANMPENLASWSIWQSPETLDVNRLPDSSGIAFTVKDETFVKDELVLQAFDTAGVQYEVRIELKAHEEGPCVAEIWREEGYELVTDPHTGNTPFFLPESFDRDQMTVLVNGTRRRGGFVKRDQVIGQTYVLDGEFTKLMTPSGKTVEVTGTLEEAMLEVLAKAGAVSSDGTLSLNDIEGETTLYGYDQNGIWQPMELLKQEVVQRYAMLMEAGEYDIELQTEVLGEKCVDKVSLLVKPSSLEFTEEEISIEIGSEQEWCLPKANASKTVLSVRNTCLDESGEFASIDWNSESDCVTIQGYETGTEYLCIARTYLDGSVDSIDLKLNIKGGKKLVLVADLQEIEFGQFQIIDVLSNDEMSDAPLQISLISEPFFGRAQIVGNSAVEYLHYGADCEKDVFTYEVCQGDICDSTTVELAVTCSEVLVYNGISPNGDGLNDELTVMGLRQYPDHVITIFNRQGNLLATFTEYENDWKGDVNGKVLPAGTYFYVIELGDGTSKSGYIQLSR